MKWFSLIYQGDVHPSTDEKIVPAKSYSKLLEAHEIVEKAHEDAKMLLEKTREECEGLKEVAKNEGFQEGLEKFNEAIIYVDQELKKIRHNMQQMVLPLVLTAAKKVVGKELQTFPETIVEIVLQALAPISQSHRVTIFVNRDDKEILEKHKARLKEILQHVEILSIEERGDITRGGCIIRTESGMINATIENQWKALEHAFEKYLRSMKK